ncbi:Cystathionine gamma-synthase [Marasmius tenuissimus]|nr:Cystathionine gamma-synthase [Marasmius tenuissimus]
MTPRENDKVISSPSLPISAAAMVERALRLRILGLLARDDDAPSMSTRGITEIPEDVDLHPTGTNAIWHLVRLHFLRRRGFDFGFPYADILKKSHENGVGNGTNNNLDDFEALLQGFTNHVLVLFTKCLSNRLFRSADLPPTPKVGRPLRVFGSSTTRRWGIR